MGVNLPPPPPPTLAVRGLTNEGFVISHSYSVLCTLFGLRHYQVVAGVSVALLAAVIC